ncbi:AAA family ATPase [Pyrococcus abyssi]|uniref:Methanol dehydrogenase regulatory protein (MoxR-2) n=1 Tax=Pyrococcus abyssi (strain GE5 / Orsay) TaxID=272844 RepID=Q9UYA6_PYRAB|nr:MoxR family ATPase [Pyrococcus abyssi]CAB50506.1 moxR-2 methanol dehydrogenase regulatory protein [Pyrococcus abyssi GE5]CCE71061.1 TPA: methanol dehydrogenase regulatory protein (moxR-2) [Pyrococcus abyssi GE5]
MNGHEFLTLLKKEIHKAVVGKDDVIELLAIALLSEGHVIIEGIPGVAKTTIAKNFAQALGLKFSRIQLTPDLFPADIIGTVYYDQLDGNWKIKKGPIFANVILADEINRAQPKTQSALLEAMQERQVTIEGRTYKLERPFLLIATKNPLEFEGVYNLPEAQLDRFMLQIKVGYPSKEEELEMLKRKDKGLFSEAKRVFSRDQIIKMIELARRVRISDEVLEYLYEIINLTRVDKRLLVGASPRAAEHLLYASKAKAFLEGRDYVIPDDIKSLAVPVLAHRLLVKAEYEVEGITGERVVREILNKVEVPV